MPVVFSRAHVPGSEPVLNVSMGGSGIAGPPGPAGPQGPPGPPGAGDGGSGRMVPLVIFNGESNSGGYAENTHALAAELAIRPAVQIFDNAGLASFLDLDIGTNNLVGHEGLTNGETHGWELGLCNSVEAGQWFNDTLYLVKTGQGASKIGDWVASGSYYNTFLQRVRTAQQILRSLGLIPTIYFWYSLGINDALAGTNEATWKTSVEDYFVRIREELGYIPIFMTKIMTSSVGAEYNDSIDAIAAADNMMFPIDVTGATTRDENHWDYGGMKLLAQRLVASGHNFGQHEAYILRRTDQLAIGGALAPAPSLPSIIRNPSAISFVEGSAGGTFTVRLSAAPSANVTIAVSISGGNAARSPSTLTFTTANWGSDQTVTVTSPNDGTASGNRSATVTLSSGGVSSAATVAVTIVEAGVGPSAPVNTTLPAVTGATGLGSVLTCSTGSWTQSPTSYAYQWKRNGSNIAGETTNTHTVIAADQPSNLTCSVIATNAQGASLAATSNSVSIPVAVDTTPVTWGNFVGMDSPSPGVARTIVTSGQPGVVAVETLDLTQPWNLEIEYATGSNEGMVAFIDDDSTPAYQWTETQVFIIGAYHFGGSAYAPRNGGTLESTGQTMTFPCRVRLSKSGDDVTYRTGPINGALGSVFYTAIGVLAGKTTGYIKVLDANPQTPHSLKVSKGPL